MEQTPPQGGERQNTPTHHIPPHDPSSLQTPESHDERIIREGIEQAEREDIEIDDCTARYIASQLHEGQASALYSLASTGTIAESLQDELSRNRDQQTRQVQTWITWLGAYCLNREHKGPTPGWAAAAIDQTEEAEHTRLELMARISAAATTTLGEIAVVVTAEQAAEDAEETDSFPWIDAARWSPTSRDDDRARDHLESLFTETPDQELGSTQHMGWFGLLKHEDRPGGVVLSRNTYGIRYVWETNSDEQLAQYWEQLQSEYDAFMRATRAQQAQNRDQSNRNDDTDTTRGDHRHTTEADRTESTEREASTRAESTSGFYPEIWVGSLSDYNSGYLHGTWLDATLDPDDLYLVIQFILRTGYDHTAEEWAIMDYDNFCGLNLDEYESLEVVSRVAQGIAEHGEAFAKWVDYVGERSEEALNRFEDHYVGKFESTEVYAEYILEETDSYRYLDEIPESIRMYAKFNTEQMARDVEIELYITGADDGGVFVFDPQS